MSTPGTPLRLSLAATMVLTVIGCGGCLRGSDGKFADLFISNQRHVIGEDKVYVYGQLENTGKGHFGQVEIRAVLRSSGGDKRGENSVFLEDIRPLEKRLFALTVNNQGRTAGVEIEVRKPEVP
jgi:hypothetical protein